MNVDHCPLLFVPMVVLQNASLGVSPSSGEKHENRGTSGNFERSYNTEPLKGTPGVAERLCSDSLPRKERSRARASQSLNSFSFRSLRVFAMWTRVIPSQTSSVQRGPSLPGIFWTVEDIFVQTRLSRSTGIKNSKSHGMTSQYGPLAGQLRCPDIPSSGNGA